ncbi:MAG: hypothetical protein JSW42_15025 [Chloroflexota bacterium]|nr:MAG: hypothetical protein JSW42_15025 [Chloroflexota bacterium]
MDNQPRDIKLAAIAVSLLLILVAVGDAILMLICSIIGLAILMYTSRKGILLRGIIAATMGITLAISISIVLLMGLQ